MFYKQGKRSFDDLRKCTWYSYAPTRIHTPPQQPSVQDGIHELPTWEKFSLWSSVLAFTLEAQFTYQMVTQNVFYCHGECATKDLDGFSCLCWLWHFPCTQPWES